MKLRNLNKKKYGPFWQYLFLELTSSKNYIFSVSSIDFNKKFMYKNKEVSFRKIINNDSFYYEIFIDNEKISKKLYQQLELRAFNRMRLGSRFISLYVIFWPFFIFVLTINLFYFLKENIKNKKQANK